MLERILRHRNYFYFVLPFAALVATVVFNRDHLLATTPMDKAAPSISKHINALDGGSLRLKAANGAYDYYLHIPPGALTEDIDVTMKTISKGEAAIALQPEGLHLNKPAVLTMIVKPVMMKTALDGKTGIYEYDDKKSEWRYQHGMTYETVDGHITSDTLIRRFSRQAIGGTGPIQKWDYNDHNN